MVGQVYLFQFPSNGKVYPKKEYKNEDSKSKNQSFNSLQTGKYIQSQQQFSHSSFWHHCFNSLQTGKYIQRILDKEQQMRISTNVSIPFKRESISKENPNSGGLGTGTDVSIPFKRESISKGLPLFWFPAFWRYVSIPFKRESISKGIRISRLGDFWQSMFQFPSNGKVYPKTSKRFSWWSIRLSCFNSLQTGKYIQSENPEARRKRNGIRRFQFPSNGKVYPKPKMKKLTLITATICFNSLQTGKYIQRDPILSPVGPWLRKPQNIREVHTAFFLSKFSHKIPQTHVYTELYAIFLQKRLESYTLSGFLGNLHRVRLWSIRRVYGYKYTSNSQECQILFYFSGRTQFWLWSVLDL